MQFAHVSSKIAKRYFSIELGRHMGLQNPRMRFDRKIRTGRSIFLQYYSHRRKDNSVFCFELVITLMSTQEEYPSTTKVLYYPIPGDETGGRVFLFGLPSAFRSNRDAVISRIVLLCAGFPDDCTALQPLAARLASGDENDIDDAAADTTNKDGVTVCGVTCLVGYDSHKPYTDYYCRDGYTPEQTVTALREATKVLWNTCACSDSDSYNKQDKNNNNHNPELIGVFHDWACVFGNILVNQLATETESTTTASSRLFHFSRVVHLDILLPLHPNFIQQLPDAISLQLRKKRRPSLFTLVAMVTYQTVLVISYLLHRYISKYAAMAWLIPCFMILGILGMAPGNRQDAKLIQRRMKTDYLDLGRMTYMAFTYYYMYKTMFLAIPRNWNDLPIFLPPNLTDIPHLYMYGADKKFHFHDETALAYLEYQSQKHQKQPTGHTASFPSKVVPVKGAGHWLYLQKPDVCFHAIREFLQR